MILSFEEPEASESIAEQDAEIRRRVRRVEGGKGVGRPVAKVLAEIETRLR